MEKLIELLNEREMGEEGGELYYLSDGVIRDDGGNILYDYRTISKEFGFIKWLVENDKIKRDEKYGAIEFYCDEYDHYACGKGLADIFEGYESLLMYLAISDNPIQDLISLLK